MPLSLRAAIAAILAVSALPPAALAERGRTTAVRQPLVSPPVKDCTRINGRIGYYANPWCSPAEQERWDRWEAARVKWR